MAILRQSDWPQRLQYFWTQLSGWARMCAGLLLLALVLTLLLWQALLSNRHAATTSVPAADPVASQLATTSTSSSPSSSAVASSTQSSAATDLPAIQPVTATATRLADWPDVQQAETISAEILGLADSTGLLFERAEFSLQTIEGSPTLAIQSIRLPVKGGYTQLRQFLHTVLQRYPSLALADCQLQRQDISQSEVSALLTLHLYVRQARQ